MCSVLQVISSISIDYVSEIIISLTKKDRKLETEFSNNLITNIVYIYIFFFFQQKREEMRRNICAFARTLDCDREFNDK